MAAALAVMAVVALALQGLQVKFIPSPPPSHQARTQQGGPEQPLQPHADLGTLPGPAPSWSVHLDMGFFHSAQVFWWNKTFPTYCAGGWGSVLHRAHGDRGKNHRSLLG